jgi:hypothetical protein
MRWRIASICCSVVIGDSACGWLPGAGAGPAVPAGGTGVGREGVVMTAEPGGGTAVGGCTGGADPGETGEALGG